MNRERRIAALALAGTLLAGILLGLWIPRLYNYGRPQPPQGRGNFQRHLFSVLKPDSAQVEKLKPIIHETMQRIDSIEQISNRQLELTLDTMKARMIPLLTTEQTDRLKDFDTKARRGGRNRGRSYRH